MSVCHSALRNIGHLAVPIVELSDYIGTVRRLRYEQSVPFDSGAEGALTSLEQLAPAPLHVAALDLIEIGMDLLGQD